MSASSDTKRRFKGLTEEQILNKIKEIEEARILEQWRCAGLRYWKAKNPHLFHSFGELLRPR